MHDKFTERVRKVMYLAREEAARLQHDYIGTEHLLLGVIREGEGIAATVLNNLGLDLDAIRQAVESMVAATGGTLTIGEIPFTPRAKRVLELSVDEARQLVEPTVHLAALLLQRDPLVDDVARIAHEVPPGLRALLDPDEVDAVRKRAKAIVSRPVFPVDTSGRRYPWPMV